MTADELDLAADRAELERASLVAAHARRAITPIPVCEECDERHVHVTGTGLRWRYCAPCAFDLTGVKP
jgi:hypothetical protein